MIDFDLVQLHVQKKIVFLWITKIQDYSIPHQTLSQYLPVVWIVIKDHGAEVLRYGHAISPRGATTSGRSGLKYVWLLHLRHLSHNLLQQNMSKIGGIERGGEKYHF